MGVGEAGSEPHGSVLRWKQWETHPHPLPTTHPACGGRGWSRPGSTVVEFLHHQLRKVLMYLWKLSKTLLWFSPEDMFSFDCFGEGSQSDIWNSEKSNTFSLVTSRHHLGGLQGGWRFHSWQQCNYRGRRTEFHMPSPSAWMEASLYSMACLSHMVQMYIDRSLYGPVSLPDCKVFKNWFVEFSVFICIPEGASTSLSTCVDSLNERDHLLCNFFLKNSIKYLLSARH